MRLPRWQAETPSLERRNLRKRALPSSDETERAWPELPRSPAVDPAKVEVVACPLQRALMSGRALRPFLYVQALVLFAVSL